MQTDKNKISPVPRHLLFGRTTVTVVTERKHSTIEADSGNSHTPNSEQKKILTPCENIVISGACKKEKIAKKN